MNGISFSGEEMDLLSDDRIFPLKYAITHKIQILFRTIMADLGEMTGKSLFPFPENTFLKPGKISKGENYNQFPYIVLDYPRMYTRQNVFALRTILWWGHYFSNAFILGGESLNQYRSRITGRIDDLRKTPWYICVHPTPWKLEVQPDNYRLLGNLEEYEIIKIIDQKSFLKLSAVYPIEEFGSLRKNTSTFLSGILDLLA